jgi:hypothetical protein
MTDILHFCAPNDYYGNPQRLYVLSNEEGKFIACWNEGYNGHHAVPGIWRDKAYLSQRFDISVTKYKNLLRTLPSPDYAHDVEGYSHLRELVNA